jgi:hypothetical protein
MSTATPATRLHAILVCSFLGVAGAGCAALAAAAALVPAPPAVIPFIVAICIGCPLVFRGELRSSIGVLRDPRLRPLRRRHLNRLRRELERLPETSHPLER